MDAAVTKRASNCFSFEEIATTLQALSALDRLDPNAARHWAHKPAAVRMRAKLLRMRDRMLAGMGEPERMVAFNVEAIPEPKGYRSLAARRREEQRRSR
jgi:hypothetical protein